MNMVFFLQKTLWKSCVGEFDVVVLGVAHDTFKNENIRSFLKNMDGVVYDVKGILDREIIDGRL